jgi:5-methylcytosine-specific restriction endonuclease McrA
VEPGGTQHGPRLVHSAQPTAGEGKYDGCRAGELAALRTTGGCDRDREGSPCQEKRLASLGDASSQRRQSVHPEGQTDLVKSSGPVSTDNVLRLLEYQQHRCALTGRALTPETASLDHVIPIRCGGQHVIENTQVLHSDVNRAKGSLTNVAFIRLCREVVAHARKRSASVGGE